MVEENGDYIYDRYYGEMADLKLGYLKRLFLSKKSVVTIATNYTTTIIIHTIST